jgi:hypothetical protein
MRASAMLPARAELLASWLDEKIFFGVGPGIEVNRIRRPIHLVYRITYRHHHLPP